MKKHTNKPKRATIRRWLVSAPEYVVACYDNGGKTGDRYTVLIGGSLHDPILDRVRAVAFLGMSETPWHPQGFSQWGEIPRGNGRAVQDYNPEPDLFGNAETPGEVVMRAVQHFRERGIASAAEGGSKPKVKNPIVKPAFQKVMFRGDPRENALTPEKAPGGIHFSEDYEYAEQYVRPEMGERSDNPVQEKKITLRNPMDFRAWFSRPKEAQTVGAFKSWLKSYGIPDDLRVARGWARNDLQTLADWLSESGADDAILTGEGIDGMLNPNQDFTDLFSESLKKLGKFDGILFPEHGNGGELTALVFTSDAFKDYVSASKPKAAPTALPELPQPSANDGPLGWSEKGSPYVDVPLRGLPDIKIIEMPELLKHARKLTSWKSRSPQQPSNTPTRSK